MEPLLKTKLSVRDFFHVVFKRLFVALAFFGITISVVSIATFLAKPMYEATSRVFVMIARENLYLPTFPTETNLKPVINVNREEQINSEIEVLKSRVLARKVIDFFGPLAVYEDLNDGIVSKLKQLFRKRFASQGSNEERILTKFQKDLRIRGVVKANVIEVGFRHQDPSMASQIVNKLVDFYLDRQRDTGSPSKAHEFFEGKLQAIKQDVKRSEDAVMAFKKKHDITSLEEERSLLLRQIVDLRSAFKETLSLEAETATRTKELRQQLASIPKTIPNTENADLNPYLINTLQARLVELELQEKELSTKYTDQNRLVRNVREEIEMVRERLNQQEQKRYGKKQFGPNPTYQKIQEELFSNEAEMKALRIKQETQRRHLEEYETNLDRFSRIESDLEHLQHDLTVSRENYVLFHKKFEEARISDELDQQSSTNVTLIEPARPPVKPVTPKVSLNLLLALFFGACGALGLTFLLEYLDDSLERAEEVERTLNLPVLASIPKFEN
jgi:uncharacterized protein involved in exopolysaccharide biosynthesis